MNEQWREDYAIRIHCVNADTDDEQVARLFDIISAHDPIVHEDCERNAVIRDSDVEGRVASLNFIGSLAGREPLTKAQRNVLLDGIKAHFGSFSGGPLNYRSESVKFAHWWSRMPLAIRRRECRSDHPGRLVAPNSFRHAPEADDKGYDTVEFAIVMRPANCAT